MTDLFEKAHALRAKFSGLQIRLVEPGTEIAVGEGEPVVVDDTTALRDQNVLICTPTVRDRLQRHLALVNLFLESDPDEH